jgi:hypothetical protein
MTVCGVIYIKKNKIDEMIDVVGDGGVGMLPVVVTSGVFLQDKVALCLLPCDHPIYPLRGYPRPCRPDIEPKPCIYR